jgi:ferrochelatase
MKYKGLSDYSHGSKECLGILLVNLGTPDAPTRPALRRYLAEFLWDPRVVEMPRALWWPILNLIILNFRPAKSAKLYREVWTSGGSPLLVISKQQRDAIARRMQERFQGRVEVALTMRYGNPSIASGLEQLQAAGARRLLILPLYPQYSAPTTASTFDAVADVLKTWRWLPEVRFVNDYCDDSAYIDSMVTRIRQFWESHDRAELLLFSYHGLPRRYLELGDPYHCQCHKTARLIAETLGLNEDQWRTSFQSRFGREEWLKPYTDETLRRLAQEGLQSVDVFCPGFSADCLETLEEIAMQNRDLFLESGGKRFNYIPALNDMPEHIEALTSLILRHAAGWPEVSSQWDQERVEETRAASRKYAIACGAAR